MHELSLCGAIADIASRRAQGRPVETIHLQIGQLRQVVPDTLIYCWEMVSAQTALEGSVLDVDRVPALLWCRSCGTRFVLPSPPAFACGACGAVEVDVVAGEEFAVTALSFAA